MPKIVYEGQEYVTRSDETILECLLRYGVSVDHSCRAGVCHSCMMQATAGTPTPTSQAGLKDALIAQNYFLICTCKPESDITLQKPSKELTSVASSVLSSDRLTPDILRLRLEKPAQYTYFPGQFVNLHGPNGVVRSYSLASLAEGEDFLELHIRHIPNGKLSGWVHRQLQPGDKLEISPATGDCFYTPRQPEQSLLLVGTGTGLAPLYGILREALRQGHTGQIQLYHGSSTADGLYLREELQAIANAHSNVHYHPCISRGTPSAGVTSGRANELALAENNKLSGWRIYLCGREDMVKDMQKKTFLAGASMKDIYADPFIKSED